MLQSSSRWSREGVWISLHPYYPPANFLGDRPRTLLRRGTVAREIAAVKTHVKTVSSQLSNQLRREHDSRILHQLQQRAGDNPYSKTALLATRLSSPGPPLDIALDWIGPVTHRMAVCSLLVGDWFLAEYAGNFFAKNLVPSSPAHRRLTELAEIEPSRVCLTCWHCHRELIAEDIHHVAWQCPRYVMEREEFLIEVSHSVGLQLAATSRFQNRIDLIMASVDATTWAAFGRFAARLRQSRRRMRTEFERKSKALSTKSFQNQRTEWRAKGGFVCRHGVFFTRRVECFCMSPQSPDVWDFAVKMPAIDHELKQIITVPFNLTGFYTLRRIQAECRRLNYS